MNKDNENETQQITEDEQADYDALTISPTRVYLIRLLIHISSLSIETYGNSNAYIEFGTLSLLQLLFHSVMPAPSFSNDVYKQQNSEMYNKKVRVKDVPNLREIDLESLPSLEIIDPFYLTLRMNLVYNVWNYVQASLDSKWTNIRKLIYKLIANMLKINFQDYDSVLQKKLKKDFHLLLNSLLESHDFE